MNTSRRTFYKKSHISSMLDYYISRVVNSSNIVTNGVMSN